MKFIKRCPVFLILAVSGFILTLIGIAGRSSIYNEYKFDVVKRPYLSLVMEGISSGITPWEMFGTKTVLSGEISDNDIGQSIEDFAEADKEQGVQPAETVETAALPAGDAEGGMAKDQTYDFQTVTEEYFGDALFIGDSRTVGLFEYGGIADRADFFAKISLTIYDVFTEKVARDIHTDKPITVEEALNQKKYGKIYLMLGINELGTGTTATFIEEYKKVVERLRELQPDAIIFLQGSMRVAGTKNETDPIFNNVNINEKNAEIAKLADNKNIFYLDVNEVVCDAEGNLNAEYTTDEIHLKAKYYEIWKKYLLEHGIVH